MDRGTGLLHQRLADRRGSRKTQLVHVGVGTQVLAHAWRIGGRGREDLQDTTRDSGLVRELLQVQGRQGGQITGFDQGRTTRRQGRSNFACNLM